MQVIPGIRLSPSTITSRRFWNSSIMASIGSHGPVTAARMARWLNAAVHETVLMIIRVTGSISSEGKAANPRRHPVMAKVFEQPSRRMVRSFIPSTAAMLACSPP